MDVHSFLLGTTFSLPLANTSFRRLYNQYVWGEGGKRETDTIYFGHHQATMDDFVMPISTWLLWCVFNCGVIAPWNATTSSKHLHTQTHFRRNLSPARFLDHFLLEEN